MEVEITLKIDESYAEAIQQFAENHGGQEIIISKPLKFEDLGLAQIEDGKYQCLACSKSYPSKSNAVRHYKNTHISRVEPTTQCPRYFISHSSFHFDSCLILNQTVTGKSLSEALLFAEHVLNVGNNFCTRHLLPRFELGIFMY